MSEFQILEASRFEQVNTWENLEPMPDLRKIY
jgi:hypothetical protein